VTGPGLGIFRNHLDFDLSERDFDLPFEREDFEFDLPFDGIGADFGLWFDGHDRDFDFPFGDGEGRFDFEFDFDLGESRFCRDGDGFPWSKDDHPNLERLFDKLCEDPDYPAP
jgi:hypothetical protein